MNQFHQQILPGISERFTGLGAGSQRSSAFAQQVGAAGAGLAGRLASMRQQQMNQFLPMLLQAGLQPQHENIYSPQRPSRASTWLSALSPLAGTLMPFAGKLGYKYAKKQLFDKTPATGGTP